MISLLCRPAFRVFLITLISLATVLTALSVDVEAQELRTWTDITGKHKMEGKYVGMTGTKVRLELKNGKKLAVELKKFSDEDQKYIESMDEDNPFKVTEDDPFGGDTEDGEAMESSPDGPVKIDWTDVEAILLETPEEWKASVAPNPGPVEKPRTVALPPKKDFFEGIVGLAANAVAGRAVACYRLGRDEKDSNLRLIMCDLQKGKTVGVAEIQALMTPIALHDDGEQVLMRRDTFGHGNHDVLELWRISGKKIQKMISWTPYDESWRPNRDVTWAEFVDADHLLTCNSTGKVALWETKTAKPLWYFDTSSGATPCLSGDRKTIGFCNGEKFGLFDIESRKFIGIAATPGPLTWPITAFSPSGQRMACIAQSRILVWETATGKLLYDFETPGIHLIGNIGFPDDNFLIGGNLFVIDLENQLKLWQYSQAEKTFQLGKLTLAAVAAQGTAGALLSLELPHKDARNLLNKALTQPDLFVFREGTKVKLDVTGIPPAEQTHVREALTKKLSDMKCSVAEDGTISLVANVTGPTERKMSYMHSGEYTVQEYLTHLSFVYQGTPAWQSSNTNIPFMLSLNRGENIEGVLRKASAKADVGYYDRVILPKFLQKPTAGQGATSLQTLGASQITSSGLK